MTAARQNADESGLSLVEALVTVLVLAVGFAVLAAGLAAAVAASGLHRAQAAVDRTLRDYAETVEAAAWQECTETSTPAYAYAPPSGFTATTVSVREWDEGAGAWVDCTTALEGVQLLTLEVSSASRDRQFDEPDVTDVLQIVKREP